jgi:hypothetical protein
MPLVGILCDDPKFKGEQYDFDTCLRCAATGGPRKCNTPYQLIYAMGQNQVERKDAGISATMLLDCARRVVLQKEVDYYEHPSAFWPRLRGTLAHLLVEQYSDGLEPKIAEVRFRRTIEIDGVAFEITGKPDMILPERKLIIDYKSNKNVEDNYQPMKDGKAKKEHIEQINIYRWLIGGGVNMDTGEITNIDIEEGQILYFDLMRWKEPISVPIWTLEETEEFIRERVRPLYIHETTGELPPKLTDFFGDAHAFCSFCPLRKECYSRA